MHYYEVSPTIIARSGINAFTYSSAEEMPIGQIVIIPIGKKQVVGVVIQKTSKPEYETKSVIEIIEDKPLPKALVETAKWMNQFYTTPLATIWQTILPKGLTKTRRTPPPVIAPYKRQRTKNVFTDDQANAIKEINRSNGVFLLHGITGSGKTLVYIEAAKQALASNKSSIVLVPEIALTSQVVAEFSQHFDNILLTHSRQTEAERHIVWKKALTSTSPQVIIGPRSALFLPLEDIGLIVIDECHEPSFKQEQSPRYSALSTAQILSSYHQAKLILGSATPSIADYFSAEQSNSTTIITMPRPARNDTAPASVELVDMTKRDNFSKHSFLSDKLLSSLEQTFANHNQALIFHNRRGTASITLCQNCGWQAGCPRCFVPLTLHSDRHKLVCHICGFTAAVPTSCPDCHNADIIHKGLGTKRIETELRRLFPRQNIARFDGDTLADSSIEKRYQELYDGDIDLIIGTQVVAKGLDLPKLRTVGVVQADAGLALPDFSAPERTFQLLAQVIGRVGRSHHPTEVIVQSFQPSHPAVTDGIAQNYTDFYQRTIRQRQHTNFPPFCHLLKLVCVYKTEKTAVKNSRQLAETMKKHASADTQVLGPTPAFHERVRDTYRWQVVIKSPHRQSLVDLLAYLPKTNWQYELDPISLL